MAAEGLEGGGVAAEGGVVLPDIVGFIRERDAGDGEGAQRGDVEDIADGANDSLGAVHLSLNGVTCDVRSGDVSGGQEGTVDYGFVFPDVKDKVAQAGPGGEQGVFVDYFAARGVDEGGAGLHCREESRIGEVAVFGPERYMERHDVSGGKEGRKRCEDGTKRCPIKPGMTAVAFRRFAWRVVEQHPKTGTAAGFGHQRSHMPYPDDAQREARPVERQCMKRGGNILRHCSGITARGGSHLDAAGRAIIQVDVVGSDSRRGHQPDGRIRQ